MKRWQRILLVTLIGLLLLILVGPFLVPVRPLPNLQPAAALAGPSSRFVTIPFVGTDGLSLHYHEQGEGEPTFILLHGFASNVYTWDKVMDFFATQGRTLAYDRPPFGLSPKLVQGDWQGANPYTDEAAIAQLLAFMDEMDVGQAILVGNSAGGTLAMKMALAHPDRVHALVLLSPAVYTGGDVPLGRVLNTPQMRHLGPLVARQLAGSDALITAAYHDPSQFTAEQRQKALITTRMEQWDEGFWAFTAGRAGGGNLPLVPRLSELTLPILVVTGDDDRVVPTAESIRLAGELAGADSTAVLINCGHVPQEECPLELTARINGWLRQQTFVYTR
jgi:pimeloyl-ACP methyl ester carboxylesterase